MTSTLWTLQNVDRSAWTGKIREFADDPSVDDSMVKRYLRGVSAVRQRDAIRDPDNNLYFTKEGGEEIKPIGGDKLAGTVLETDRAIYWEGRSDVKRVEIEPGKSGGEAGPYDLKVVKTDGSTEYIEVKNVNPNSGPLDAQKLRNKIWSKKDGEEAGIQQQLEGSSIANDRTAVGTIGARRLSDELDFREAVFREIRDGIVNSDRPVQFEKLRIVVGTGQTSESSARLTTPNFRSEGADLDSLRDQRDTNSTVNLSHSAAVELQRRH